MKVETYLNVDDDIVKDVKKYRPCLSEKSAMCKKRVFGFRGNRICPPCKLLNTSRPKDTTDSEE